MIKFATILAVGLSFVATSAVAQDGTSSSVTRHLPGEVLPPGDIFGVAARCSWKKNPEQALTFSDKYYDGMAYEDVKPLWNAATKECNLPLGRIDDWEIRDFSLAMDEQHAVWLIACLKKSSPQTIDAFRSEFAKAKKAQIKAYVDDAVHSSDSSALLTCDPNMDNPKHFFSVRRANFLTKVIGRRVNWSQNVGAQHATELS